MGTVGLLALIMPSLKLMSPTNGSVQIGRCTPARVPSPCAPVPWWKRGMCPIPSPNPRRVLRAFQTISLALHPSTCRIPAVGVAGSIAATSPSVFTATSGEDMVRARVKMSWACCMCVKKKCVQLRPSLPRLQVECKKRKRSADRYLPNL